MNSRVLVKGTASGRLLRLGANISFWGGVDPLSGLIIDRRHPQFGESVGGRIIALTQSIGSSSGSSILLELLSRDAGPAGIILGVPDQILTLGAVVAQEMGYHSIPVVLLDRRKFDSLPACLRIGEDGSISSFRMRS